MEGRGWSEKICLPEEGLAQPKIAAMRVATLLSNLPREAWYFSWRKSTSLKWIDPNASKWW